VARIDLVGKEITSGIRLSPEKKGVWVWLNDRHIQFVPETDWPAGTEYSISFDESVFANHTLLSEDEYLFSTLPFEMSIRESEFYQDPQNISIRRVVSTVEFTHPVDKISFEKVVSMEMLAEKALDDKNKVQHDFSITYSKNLREAYITSSSVNLPEEPSYMTLTIGDGVSTILGGEEFLDGAEDKIFIPDIYSFLKVDKAHVSIVRNSLDEPEQVLVLEFTDDIEQKELLEKLSVYKLPEADQFELSSWNSPRQVDDNVLLKSEKVELKQIANERDSSKTYSFVIDVPESQDLYIRINSNFRSVNDFKCR